MTDADVGARAPGVGGLGTWSKRSLVTLSHSIEDMVLAIAPDQAPEDRPLLLATFQRPLYFDQERRRYKALAKVAAEVIIVVVDPDEPDVPPGVTGCGVEELHPLADEWSVVVVGPTIGAALVTRDRREWLPDEDTLERGRSFEGAWTFRRAAACDEASRLLAALGELVPQPVRERAAAIVERARSLPETATERHLNAGMEATVRSLESTNLRLRRLDRQFRNLVEASDRDPLTGLYNRRFLARWLGDSVSSGVPSPPLGVVLFDCDKFKSINDDFGHAAGDVVLKAIAGAITAAVRSGDVVVRWGGDEFMVLLPNMSLHHTRQLADRVVSSVAALQLPPPLEGVRTALSAGVALTTVNALPYGEVDAALYEAKAKGGSQAVLAALASA